MMEAMLRKPVHFWRYSVVIERFFGTVELTLSDGQSDGFGVGRWDGDDAGKGDVSSCSTDV